MRKLVRNNFQQRNQLEILLEQSPTLRNLIPHAIENRYSKAVKKAIQEMELLNNPFPPECPFSAGHLLDEDYLPE